MKSRRAVLGIAILAVVFPLAGNAAYRGRTAAHKHAAHMGKTAVHKYGLEAKYQFCTECHGKAGHGYRGYYAIPQLAGQQAQYLENQFNTLADRVRDDPVAKRFMWPNLAHVPKDMFPILAKRLSELDAAPAADGPRHLVEAGRKIFEEGVPDANVPACAACHGADAHGQDQVPRLAGQLYPYLLDELTDWQHGHRSKDSADTRN